MKFKKVCPAEIVDLIRKNEYYCLEELKFNSDTKFLLYGLEVLVVEMEAINFSLHFEVNAPVKSFYEAVYALSLLNPASSQDKATIPFFSNVRKKCHSLIKQTMLQGIKSGHSYIDCF